MNPGPVGPIAEGAAPVYQQTSVPQAIGNEALGWFVARLVVGPPCTGTERTVPAVDESGP
jgi:hypothetical protein